MTQAMTSYYYNITDTSSD